MKKLLALLLVLCMLVGLVACGGKKDEPSAGNNTTPTSGSSTTDPTGGSATEDPHLTVTPETSPYKGKTLQIYGLGNADSYTDYSIFGKGNFVWMMKAAVDEWATINGVTIEYKGSYNQAQVLASMTSGDHPDLIFATEKFPSIANVGVVTAFTEAEYNKLAAICDETYLNALKFRGSSVGFVYPWTGVAMCYYNKTMFENYGVKTPKEYYMDGEWTWENFMKCMEEVTKDIDSDGVTDTYGIHSDSFTRLMQYPQKMNDKGELVSILDEPIVQDFIELKYNTWTKKLVYTTGGSKIQKNVTYPMYAMQISDCEPYNFEHLYQSIPNGDELEVVPVPVWNGDKEENKNYARLTEQSAFMVANCDEREAAVDLLAYLLKCGLKYVSDFSLGAVKCDYVGMQGKSELSKTWKENFAQVCADRAAAIKEIENYDEALVAKMNEQLSQSKLWTEMNMTSFTAVYRYSEITKIPPASSIPAIRAKYEAALKTYNDTYITAN
ncbi:MAG: extracellular solute-binding protein [Oscillospiraceae bacterium]|nr:extracellular solute-binding protein [Oscillospiraceae bacterium]